LGEESEAFLSPDEHYRQLAARNFFEEVMMMGKGRSKMSNLEIAFDNISAAFREGEKAGITVEKDNWRDETYATYEKEMKTMVKDLANDLGVDSKRVLPKYMNGSTWDKYFEKLAQRHDEGTLSAGTIQKRVHALEAFRTMVNSTNVCGKDTKIRVGDKEERLDYLKDQGVVRTKDEITAIKPTKDETAAVHSNINTSTQSGKTSLEINKLQVECGGRIKSMFKLEVRDVDFKEKTITFRNDKNNYTRTVPMTVAAEKILTTACSGKKDGTPVFTLKDTKGNDMDLKNSVKTVQKYTNDAAKKAGVNRENRRYTTHSNRKQYAQNLYNQTRYMSNKDLEKAIGNYVKSQGSNREKVAARIKTELDRINAYRKSKGMDKKGFSHEQLRRMLVSLHLGHSRCDVVLHYIKPDAIAKKAS
jgi:integrase